MDTDRKWIVVRVDGKLAGISQDYGRLAEIAARIAQGVRAAGYDSGSAAPKDQKTRARKKTEGGKGLSCGEVTARTVSFEEVWALRKSTRWEDLLLFGTEFQKRVWKTLWDHVHPKSEGVSGLSESRQQPTDGAQRDNAAMRFKKPQSRRLLLSYTDFAELCDNRAGVRAVAHAIGLNPLPVLIPCHLVVPKDTIDRISEIHRKAESTIFKGEDLCRSSILNDNAIDVGEYALGRELKRKLISMEISSSQFSGTSDT